MQKSIAIVGAGVSGLTCGVALARRGIPPTIFAEETGPETTSAVAAAMWFPYDVGPADKVLNWARETYAELVRLSAESRTGVSMIELRTFRRGAEIEIPEWAVALGARRLTSAELKESPVFASGFVMRVPLTDTTIYLDYLSDCFAECGGSMAGRSHFDELEQVDRQFKVLINCSGVGARTLGHDTEVEPHRGQVAIVPKSKISSAYVCDDPPLMYVIPRATDCVLGGSNDVSDDRQVDPALTSRIVEECGRCLNTEFSKVTAERVGLRPFRKSGVRLERETLRDGRTVIHNYGHGGSGFTLSWGCADEVVKLCSGGL